MAPRYAIYFSPEPSTPLDAFAQQWLGPDDNSTTRQRTFVPAVAGIAPDRVRALTDSTWRYRFHGTLKPPFELNPASSREALMAAAHIFAKGMAPIELQPFELATIGKFIALAPIKSSGPLENLAGQCVRAFESFRGPLSAESMAHYMRNKLTVHQTQMLEHWGYPYVMEEFRLHISLTDRIEDATERAAMMKALQHMTTAVVNKPIVLRELAVFYQTGRDQPMVVLDRIPFGRAA